MNKRKSTKYPGVQTRESESRRYRGKADICYTIDYRDESGKRVRKDVGWASEGFSAALAAEMRSRLINAVKTKTAMGAVPFPARGPAITLGEAWEKYKKDWLLANNKQIGSSEGLIREHLGDLTRLPLNEITAYRLDQLMAEMRDKGRAPQTIRHAVALIRRIMNRMVKWNIYNGSLPFAALTLPRANNARERFLTPVEARTLLTELKRRSPQTWLMALISLHCGLRFGEIARLRWPDIDFENMAIFIGESKSGRSRHAVMTGEVKAALEDWQTGRKSSLIFPDQNGGVKKFISDTFVRVVNSIGLNAGISDRRQKVVFHTLRHTYASWLAKGGQGQLVIADRLGHHSLEMSKRYTHLMDETRRESAEAISRIFHANPPENQS